MSWSPNTQFHVSFPVFFWFWINYVSVHSDPLFFFLTSCILCIVLRLYFTVLSFSPETLLEFFKAFNLFSLYPHPLYTSFRVIITHPNICVDLFCGFPSLSCSDPFLLTCLPCFWSSVSALTFTRIHDRMSSAANFTLHHWNRHKPLPGPRPSFSQRPAPFLSHMLKFIPLQHRTSH